MPHQCVRCGRLYDDGSKVVLSGCQCGGRFFFFVKKKEDVGFVQKLTADLTQRERAEIETAVKERVQELEPEFSVEEKKEMEEQALEMVGESEEEKPIVVDVESIRILKPGTFGLNLPKIFRKEPLIYRLEEGKYVLDIASAFGAGKAVDKILSGSEKKEE